MGQHADSDPLQRCSHEQLTSSLAGSGTVAPHGQISAKPPASFSASFTPSASSTSSASSIPAASTHPYPQYPLYDPADEHDSCGTGFVAALSGEPSHRIVAAGLEALANLAHRGAMDADNSSDGTGVMTQIPTRLLHGWLEAHKLDVPAPGKLAVGMVFLPRHTASAQAIRREVNAALAGRGFGVLGWRQVPLAARALGRSARGSQPRIEQVLARVPDTMTPDEAERQLYVARREAEQRVAAHDKHGEHGESAGNFYIPSLSARNVVYKGLVTAANLPVFYPDLLRPDYESALIVFHQRYSTNTFPSWPLAQPMRLLAHNGEINTVRANRSWMRAHEAELEAIWQGDAASLRPVIEPSGSDSTSLDNALELVARSGRTLPDALVLLVPEVWEGNDGLTPAVRDFYRVRAPLMGPWDGPAALVFSDGRYVGAMLDRNGLRPMRYVLTDDGLVIVASEVGVVALPPASIVEKGRLGPGQVLAVDTLERKLWRNDDLKATLAARHPYGEWHTQRIVTPDDAPSEESAAGEPASTTASGADDLLARQALFGYGHEDMELVMRPLALDAAEAIWSMGDDTPLAVLARQRRPLAAYFRQRFAQVTNPPIDPLRERLVMSLTTYLGGRGSCLVDALPPSPLIELDSPVLDGAGLRAVRATAERLGIAEAALSTTYAVGAPTGDEAAETDAPGQRLRAALDDLGQSAVAAVIGGAGLLVLTDQDCPEHEAPLPQPLAIAAVHEALLAAGLRLRAGLVVETGAAWDVHSIALLLAYGANAVHPYLALRSARSLAGTRGAETLTPELASENYRHAIEKGLCKVLSRMGLSLLESYIGGQQFECIGIDEEIVARYFAGTPVALGGLSLAHLHEQAVACVRDAAALALAAREAHRAEAAPAEGANVPGARPTRLRLVDRGLVRYRKDGEYHAANPQIVKALQKAAETGNPADYAAFAEQVRTRPPTALHDLLTFKKRRAIPKSRVEPAEAIVTRFVTSAMSLGALSPEAHLTLTLGANAIGARSNTGEGGEDPAWRHGMRDGVSMNSKVKQVASGRFGVTTDYLVKAEELEIKMAQGSKPGEGGQLPPHKVTDLIARLRHTQPGTSLISPPPHHDIYSIEDIAQLIYDLRQVNPRAAIGVKLVAECGVGTVAAGVAKAHADYVLISGHDGGTGASPLSSIKYAGVSWELGLAEAQQVLRLNRLRARVRVRVDGGFKTGRDVVIGALLGADEFAFGTGALIALGCDMARQCHLDTCPTGIATQREDLRRKFTGTPGHVSRYLLALAEEVREILAQLGARTLDEIIGHPELLTVDETRLAEVAATGLTRAHIAPLLAPGDGKSPRRAGPEARRYRSFPVAEDTPPALIGAEELLKSRGVVVARQAITNRERAVGARLGGAIAERWGEQGLPAGSVVCHYTGNAGQSFGAFAAPGMRLILDGDANDYVGKGMSGGELVIAPSVQGSAAATEQVVLGNTALYGATGGLLVARGRAGERFAVRNSGAVAVVEGLGDHGCEYMTSGAVVVLGPVGRNFAAGMSGGVAYMLGEETALRQHLNGEMAALERPEGEAETRAVRELVARHQQLTGSDRAEALLADWDGTLGQLWRVRPKALASIEGTVRLMEAIVRPPEVAAHAAPREVRRDEEGLRA